MSHNDTILDRLREKQPSLWINPAAGRAPEAAEPAIDIAAAEARLDRAQPLLAKLFSRSAAGRVTHSPLIAADALGAALGADPQMGRWLVKADHELPIAGSVKARGGFHEVLAYAERLAIEQGLIAPDAPLMA
ncbi:MAG: D-serine ammonia-lyase, partial [Blastomonas sp.]|nr:D-serine ammonia-lyase [Blastomonas sp.]